MRRIKITVAYDGTNYCGWQVQPNGITVEEVLNRTLSQFLQEEIHVIGASRTDAGVHALGNVAVFDSATTIPPEKICFAVNQKLPADIRIVASEQAEDDFHPRYCDTKKTYEYHIQNVKIPFPTKRLYAHLVTAPLDVEAMSKAGRYLVGTHDFKSFCASKTQARTTVRTVTDLQISAVPLPGRMGIGGKPLSEEKSAAMLWGGAGSQMPGKPQKDVCFRKMHEQEIIIRVEGTGFLYNMVRIISGTLIKVGLHVYPPEHVKEILAACDRAAAGETAPAKGLFLTQIEYL